MRLPRASLSTAVDSLGSGEMSDGGLRPPNSRSGRSGVNRESRDGLCAKALRQQAQITLCLLTDDEVERLSGSSLSALIARTRGAEPLLESVERIARVVAVRLQVQFRLKACKYSHFALVPFAMVRAFVPRIAVGSVW